MPPGLGVEQPHTAPGIPGYVAYCAEHRVFGNVNLHPPGIEALYGPLGNPRLEQGHPFMREYDPLEQEDPTKGLYGDVHHDQVLDIDRGIQINHTGRLSGSFVEFIASKPFFSSVIASAVCVQPVTASTQSIRLKKFVNWLEPGTEQPNTWFWRPTTTTFELLYTGDVRVDDPTQIPDSPVSFEPEAVYKLVLQWKFWKYMGGPPYPNDPPDPDASDSNCKRLGISGFDEAMAFEVVRETHELGGED